ncbi:hypothetical protein ACFCT7_08940 [Fulvivirgaceae bacterium LMO-SS25]
MELLLYKDKTMIRLIFYTTIILITISCSDLISNQPDLGKGYKFVHEGKYGLSIVNEKNTIVVQQHVLEYKYDSVFVAQRPFNSISGRDTMTYSEFNKEFKNSTFKQYWIIDKTKDCENVGFDSVNQIAKYSNVFGPYLKNEFMLKRNILGVPKELKFEQE